MLDDANRICAASRQFDIYDEMGIDLTGADF